MIIFNIHLLETLIHKIISIRKIYSLLIHSAMSFSTFSQIVVSILAYSATETGFAGPKQGEKRTFSDKSGCRKYLRLLNHPRQNNYF